MTAIVVAIGVCIALLPWLARLVAGPTAFDRMLAGHVIWCGAALVSASLAVKGGADTLLDAALAFALVDGVLVLVALKAMRRNSFQPALAPLDESATS